MLFKVGYRPLSTVRDMIGSQGTKGVHFLLRAQLRPSGIGVWTNSDRTVTELETYPAAARRDVDVDRLTSRLLAELLGRERQQRSDVWQRDARDAITCALVAWLHRRHLSRGTLGRTHSSSSMRDAGISEPVSAVPTGRRAS